MLHFTLNLSLHCDTFCSIPREFLETSHFPWFLRTLWFRHSTDLSWRRRGRMIYVSVHFILSCGTLPRAVTYFILRESVICGTRIKSFHVWFLPLADTDHTSIYFALCSESCGICDVSRATHVDLYFVPRYDTRDTSSVYFRTNTARYSQGRGIT